MTDNAILDLINKYQLPIVVLLSLGLFSPYVQTSSACPARAKSSKLKSYGPPDIHVAVHLMTWSEWT